MAQSPINAGAIPVPSLDAGVLQLDAGWLRDDAGKIRTQGADIKSTWAGLASVYHAPEDAQLLAVMDPVATSTDAFATDTEQVASILSTFASEAGPLVDTLNTTKASAGTFEAKAKGKDDWDHDGDMVKQNNDLVHTVNTTIVAFQAAERKAANAIEAIIGGHSFHVADPNSTTQDKYAYGYSSIPDNAKTPWGADVTKKDGCLKSSLTHVGHFFEGAGEAIWGMVKGIGTLAWDAAGFGGWKKFTAAWSGINFLVNLTNPIGWVANVVEYGPKGTLDRLAAMGKGLVDWDEWKKDPSKALGYTVTSIGTLFIPVGGEASAAADGARGAEAAAKVADVAGDAGKASKVSSTLGKAGELTKAGLQTFGKLTDPFHYVAQLPKVLDVAKGLGIKIPDFGAMIGHDSPVLTHVGGDAGHDVGTGAGHDVGTGAGHDVGTGGGSHDTGTGSGSHDTGTGSGSHDTGTQHEGLGTDGRHHVEGDPQGTYRDSDGRLQNDHGGYATDPHSHANIDVHAVKGDTHVITDHPASYDAQVANRSAAQAQHTTDLANQKEIIAELKHEGVKVDPAKLSSTQLDKELARLSDSPAAHDNPAVLDHLADLRAASEAEHRSLASLSSRSEQLGMTAAHDVIKADGGHVILGEDAARAGRPHELDTAGISDHGRTLTVVEAKGGDSTTLGSRMVGDVRAQQGSTAYLNDLLHRDPRFADYLHEHPDFAARFARGDVHVEYKLVEARANGVVRVTDFHVEGNDLHLSDLGPKDGVTSHVSTSSAHDTGATSHGFDGPDSANQHVHPASSDGAAHLSGSASEHASSSGAHDTAAAPHDPAGVTSPAPAHVRLADGTTHEVQFSDAHLHQATSSSSALTEALARHNLTPEQLGELIRTPQADLTTHQVHVLQDVRSSVPEIRTDEVMSKALNGRSGDALLDHRVRFPEDSVQGFVARAGDMAGVHGVADQRDALALTYHDGSGNPAFPADAPYSYSMRYTTADPHVPEVPLSGRFGDTYDAPAPYTGNGFTASEHHMVPEYRYDRPVDAQPGAEMWRMNQDGSEQLAGVLDADGHWVRVG